MLKRLNDRQTNEDKVRKDKEEGGSAPEVKIPSRLLGSTEIQDRLDLMHHAIKAVAKAVAAKKTPGTFAMTIGQSFFLGRRP